MAHTANPKIKRALVSVSNKEGIVEFCDSLSKNFGVEIISTGGTLKTLLDAGVEAIDISQHTGFPEIMDGRVKTLHPKVHGGILSRREIDQQVMSENEIKEILQDGKKQGEEQFQKLQDKLISKPRLDNTLPNVKKISRPSCNYEIDRKIAKGMNKIFKLLQLRSKPFIDFSGSQIDVDEYVENITRGTNLNRCYENSKSVHGASIVISIDASLSMHDEKIITARNLVATLFESIKGIPNMELRGNIWSSHGSGLIGITEINNIKDVKQISVRSNFNLTPLHMGLEYSMKMLKEMRGTNKLLILITDGEPNYYKNHNLVPDNIYNNQCKRSLQKVLKITPNVICFLVGKEDNNIKKIMTDIFTSKRFIIVPTMKKASQNTIEKFRHFVIKNVQNGG